MSDRDGGFIPAAAMSMMAYVWIRLNLARDDAEPLNNLKDHGELIAAHTTKCLRSWIPVSSIIRSAGNTLLKLASSVALGLIRSSGYTGLKTP